MKLEIYFLSNLQCGLCKNYYTYRDVEALAGRLITRSKCRYNLALFPKTCHRFERAGEKLI
jgi:hypothetical protein